MGLIQKIALTPAKWASKRLLHAALLTFPGGEQSPTVACVYCPEMCRFSCPVAVATGNDLVTPSAKMSLLYQREVWPEADTSQVTPWPIFDCTGCGRCTEYCEHDVPVAERLFEARSNVQWKPVMEALLQLTDDADPCGDLAEELGDHQTATRRREQWLATGAKDVSEPKQLWYLQSKLNQTGVDFRLSWADKLNEEGFTKVATALAKDGSDRKWLWAESVWLNRRLKRADEVAYWLFGLKRAGVQIQEPFAQGIDCIDTGGEGAYPLLFPEQALEMAREYWERDRHRVGGILCASSRMASHLRKVVDSTVPIYSLRELL